MSENTPKLPKSEGAEKAVKAIKKIRNQPPSDRLVNIISEYGNHVSTEKDDSTKKSPIAVKDVEL